MRRLLLVFLALLPLSCPAQIPVASAGIASVVNCPTGQPCGATAPYCQTYTPPSTSGATLISSLPYDITAAGNYYLNSDLSSTGIGIYVTYTGGSPIDINLNGHTVTYGTVANGSGSSSIGEYGILSCNTGNLSAENMASAYSSNGYCVGGGISPGNVTVENGTIVQSTNASQYYNPNNCPGSGVGSGSGGACGSHEEPTSSTVINFPFSYNDTFKHLTLNWQNVDAQGIVVIYRISSDITKGDDIECNVFNDAVLQINNRAYPRGMDIEAGGNQSNATGNPDTIQYNTMVGSPQMNIADNQPGTVIEYNDMNIGYYQSPPFTTFLHAYSNDYNIGSYAAANGGTIAYNYIHNQVGRCIGIIYQTNMSSLNIFNNYCTTQEPNTNGEYGPNGTTNGGTWPNPSGCEIDGSRGFESKASTSVSVYNNTFIVNVSLCGGSGIDFTEFPCLDEGACPTPAGQPFNFHDNVIQMVNSSGSSTLYSPQDVACYSFDQVEGNTSNYFSTSFTRESCTSDGDFINSDPYSGGDYFTWSSPTWTKGSHPLSSGCGNTTSRTCGHMVHWEGQGGTDPPDELGYIIQNISFANGATLNYSGEPADSGITLNPRGSTAQWNYTPTIKCTGTCSGTGGTVNGATVTVTSDNIGGTGGTYSYPSCTTNSSGQCTLLLRYQYIASPSGSATLTTTSGNPSVITISASGCTTQSGHNVTLSQAPFTETITLTGSC